MCRGLGQVSSHRRGHAGPHGSVEDALSILLGAHWGAKAVGYWGSGFWGLRVHPGLGSRIDALDH